jgi:hypothetical protein
LSGTLQSSGIEKNKNKIESLSSRHVVHGRIDYMNEFMSRHSVFPKTVVLKLIFKVLVLLTTQVSI